MTSRERADTAEQEFFYLVSKVSFRGSEWGAAAPPTLLQSVQECDTLRLFNSQTQNTTATKSGGESFTFPQLHECGEVEVRVGFRDDSCFSQLWTTGGVHWSILLPFQGAAKQRGGHQIDKVHLGCGAGEALKAGLVSCSLAFLIWLICSCQPWY